MEHFFEKGTVNKTKQKTPQPFIIQTNKCTTYILKIFYISSPLLHVSMHPHHLQGVISLYFVTFTKLLKFELNNINIYTCCAFVGLDNKLQDARHIKIIDILLIVIDLKISNPAVILIF